MRSEAVPKKHNKLRDIVAITYYIFFIIVTFPPQFLCLYLTKSLKRELAITKMRRELKHEGVPRKLRREIVKTYRKALSRFSLRSLLLQSIRGEKNEFKGTFGEEARRARSKIKLYY